MISCQQHDYIEIACLYQFLIRVTLSDNTMIEGIAKDTLYNQHHQQCLLLLTEHGEIMQPIEKMLSLEALTANPHFSHVEFSV